MIVREKSTTLALKLLVVMSLRVNLMAQSFKTVDARLLSHLLPLKVVPCGSTANPRSCTFATTSSQTSSFVGVGQGLFTLVRMCIQGGIMGFAGNVSKTSSAAWLSNFLQFHSQSCNSVENCQLNGCGVMACTSERCLTFSFHLHGKRSQLNRSCAKVKQQLVFFLLD